MNLPKHLVGREVRLAWVDPRALRLTSYFPGDHRDVPHGEAGLAWWEEWGKIEKIEDGVVYLLQGMAKDHPGEERQQHDLQFSVVPESLIRCLTVLVDGEVFGEKRTGGNVPTSPNGPLPDPPGVPPQ